MQTIKPTTLFLALVTLLAVPSTAAAQDSERDGVELADRDDQKLGVLDMAIGTDIESRKPVGVSDHFRADVGKLACWVKLRNDGEPTEVTIVWRFDDNETQRQTIEVGTSPRWRSWTRQRIWGKFSGQWSCEVLTDEGDSLGKAVVKIN